MTSSGRFNITKLTTKAKSTTKAARVSINEGFNRIRTMTNERMELLTPESRKFLNFDFRPDFYKGLEVKLTYKKR